MALTKADIAEIQESAKFNHLAQIRRQKEKEELKEAIAKRIAQPTQTKTPKTDSKESEKVEKKGK